MICLSSVLELVELEGSGVRYICIQPPSLAFEPRVNDIKPPDLTPTPAGTAVGPSGPWRSYKERVSLLAQRIVEAQRPIQILNSIKWNTDVFERFRASGWREMPVVGLEDYQRQDLGFDAHDKMAEFREIE